MATLKEIIENEWVNERHLFVKGHNLTNTARNWNTVRDRIKLILFTYIQDCSLI